MLHAEGGVEPEERFYESVRRACGEVVSEVDVTHRLVDQDNQTELIVELFSDGFDSRVLALPAKSQSARLHSDLAESKLPVFSSLYTEEVLLLLVPEGARSVASLLPAFARDPQAYGQIFYEVGRVLRDLEARGLGLPEQALTDSLAFAVDEKAEHGARLFLVPPYTFLPPGSQGEALDEIRFELELTSALSDEVIDIAMQNVQDGWHAIG